MKRKLKIILRLTFGICMVIVTLPVVLLGFITGMFLNAYEGGKDYYHRVIDYQPDSEGSE